MRLKNFAQFIESIKVTNVTENEVKEIQENILNEGGASGHMSHPYDERDLTFSDYKIFIERGLQGDLNFDEVEPSEKTDGQNCWVTIKGGEVLFARNKGQSLTPLSLEQFKTYFKDHASPSVRDVFTFFAEDMESALSKLSKELQEKFFKNGMAFANCELIWSGSQNVINYDGDYIQVHGMIEINEKGEQVSVENLGKELEKELTKIQQNIQKTFKIIPPQVLVIAKDIDFEEKKSYFFKKLDTIMKSAKMDESSSIEDYLYYMYEEEISKYPILLEEPYKVGLLRRWVLGDKKTLNLRDLKKSLKEEPKVLDWVVNFDKKGNKEFYKKVMLPIQNLFIELGVTIIKNVTNLLAADVSKESERLRKSLESELSKIKKNGDVTQITKLEGELSKLDNVGGLSSLVATEGIVFKYKGKTIKLTGSFAPLNQLLGIIRYGR